MGAPTTVTKPKDYQELSEEAASRDESSGSCRTYLSLIQQYLSMFQVDNAVWLAERCVAEFPNCQEAVYLHALCFYRLGKIKTARHILDRSISTLTQTISEPILSNKTLSSVQYLSAQCSYELGDYNRGETILLKEARKAYKQANTIENMDDWILKASPCPIPNGAAGLGLLGKICRKSCRNDRAIKYFKMSLQLDPFLFTSFQAVCELGDKSIDASEVFGGRSLKPPPSEITNQQRKPHNAVKFSHLGMKTPLQPMEIATTASPGSTNIINNHRLLPFETPGLTPIAFNESTSQTPVRNNVHTQIDSFSGRGNSLIVGRALQVATRQYYPPSPESTPALSTVTRSMRYLRGLGTSDVNDSTDPTTVTSRSLFQRTIAENSTLKSGFCTTKLDSAMAHDQYSNFRKSEKFEISNDASTISNQTDFQDILDLLTVSGTVYKCLCQYQCKEALQFLQSLPLKQQSTSWALQQQGRSFLELGDFQSSQRCLEYMHKMDPSQMQGLELLSTVYWQLKKEIELANLAQNALDWDFLSPEAHCVVGNCFSLQKDHETALIFFKRSLQLDPDFTYTHTLSGYEYMSNEDFEKAIACFRQALRTNERHYNAWYGLGAIYHRQEKFDLAEYHFEKAVSLHPTSSVLRCNLGMSQFANGKAYQALETLSEAFRLDPRNPQARFQRATIYSALHRPEEALVELKSVRDAAPREATVHFALGKVLKRLGRPDEAMKCFLTAMDLDPKDNQLIKSAMDKLDEPDVDEESMGGF